MEDSPFEDWTTTGSAVFLNGKLILIPETNNKSGAVYKAEPFNFHEEFELEVGLDVSNTEKTEGTFSSVSFHFHE
jgi:hypothetical protein